jgi:N-acyl homoserine lactone hydrolase
MVIAARTYLYHAKVITMKLTVFQSALYVEGENRAPFPFYLIQTDDGKNVLVDTGVAPYYPLQTRNASGALVVQQTERETTLNQLAALGLSADDIHYVIATHFDEDHCGGNVLFPQAEIVVQQSHYELACSGREARFEVCRAFWDSPDLHYRQINGDLELLPDIQILVTDGHVTGHQSVLVRLPNTGAVLLAIDAIRDGEMLTPGVDPRAVSMFDMDGDKLIEGVHKLQAAIERENVQLTILGHDWTRWLPLRKAPAFYD